MFNVFQVWRLGRPSNYSYILLTKPICYYFRRNVSDHCFVEIFITMAYLLLQMVALHFTISRCKISKFWLTCRSRKNSPDYSVSSSVFHGKNLNLVPKHVCIIFVEPSFFALNLVTNSLFCIPIDHFQSFSLLLIFFT